MKTELSADTLPPPYHVGLHQSCKICCAERSNFAFNGPAIIAPIIQKALFNKPDPF